MHVYSIPRDTLSTTSGYAAASWTASPRNHIFTARLRILETSFTPTASSPSSPAQSTPPTSTTDEENANPVIKVDILLEDPSSTSLFAAAPYTAPAAVEPTTDSSRFFAIRVQDPTGKQKATLGIGFEERSEAFDFGVALQEAGRALKWAGAGTGPQQQQGREGGGLLMSKGVGAGSLLVAGAGGGEAEKRDLSLKEGETITVNLSGTRFGRRAPPSGQSQAGGGGGTGEEEGRSLASFALPPPPAPATSISAREARAQKRLSAQQMGFDDGQFGEFA